MRVCWNGITGVTKSDISLALAKESAKEPCSYQPLSHRFTNLVDAIINSRYWVSVNFGYCFHLSKLYKESLINIRFWRQEDQRTQLTLTWCFDL